MPGSLSITRSAKRSPANKVTGVGIKRIFTLCSVHLGSANPFVVSGNCWRTWTFPAVVIETALVQVNVLFVLETIDKVSSVAVPDV